MKSHFEKKMIQSFKGLHTGMTVNWVFIGSSNGLLSSGLLGVDL